MADYPEKPASPDSPEPTNPQQAAVERVLMSFGEQTFAEYSRFRFAEEREWYEQALFYQRRQWLRWNDTSRRFDQVKQDPDRPKPMPVSNYFAKAISDNANQLGPVRITTVPGDDSDANRRSAEYAQRAIPAIDKETGFDLEITQLSKHVPLWGIGVTKDLVDTSLATGQRNLATLKAKSTFMVSCLDCGQTSQVTQPAPSPGANPQNADQPAQPMNEEQSLPGADSASDAELPQTPCPNCGSQTTMPFRKNSLEVDQNYTVPLGKLCTEVVPIFDVYLPRDCRHPNLAKRVVHRYRKSLGYLRDRYGDRAKNIKAEAPYDVHQIYMEALRALVNYNYMHEQTLESTTITEVWSDWDELPRKLQTKLEQYWESINDFDTIETAYRSGIYEIHAAGVMLDWGVNPWWDATEECAYKPFTFFLWELDPANVYPKGVAVDLVPLQKRLNRIDSLIDLGIQCNSAGKWLWPTTQTTKPPSGSPNETVAYDVIGDGKVAPTFVQPSPFHEMVPMVRQSILSDFQQLGNTLGPAQGQVPSNVKSFRGQAMAAQKAEETTNTQRALWEQGNALRYRKLLLMAQKTWSQPRKTRVAGYNGKFGMMALEGQMMSGNYTVHYVADSSRPVLPAEKKEAFAELLKAGMVDVTDSSIREYIIDLQNLNDLDLADHLQYEKAERDLELLKRGQVPQDSPYQKWDIFLKVFGNFTLTEEFEQTDPQIQQVILTYADHATQMLQQQAQEAEQAAIASATEGKELATKGSIQYLNPVAAGPDAGALADAMKGATPQSPAQKPLGQVPGKTASSKNVQSAAGAAAGKVNTQPGRQAPARA